MCAHACVCEGKGLRGGRAAPLTSASLVHNVLTSRSPTGVSGLGDRKSGLLTLNGTVYSKTSAGRENVRDYDDACAERVRECCYYYAAATATATTIQNNTKCGV